MFKLVKFISSVNDNFNENIIELENKKKEKNNKNDENEKNNSNKNLITKKDMLNKLKSFIKNINDILFPCWEQLNNLLLDINSLLKDNQDIIVPKLNRLIPYLETFITLSHLQFISTNSSSQTDKNAFIFEKKFIADGDRLSLSSPPHAKNEIDAFVEFFYEFCEKNKKIINFILRQYPKKCSLMN